MRKENQDELHIDAKGTKRAFDPMPCSILAALFCLALPPVVQVVHAQDAGPYIPVKFELPLQPSEGLVQVPLLPEVDQAPTSALDKREQELLTAQSADDKNQDLTAESDGGDKAAGPAPTNPSEGMPESLTKPVLPNVPSSVDETVVELPKSGKKPANNGQSKPTPATKQKSDSNPTKTTGKSKKPAGKTKASQQPNAKKTSSQKAKPETSAKKKQPPAKQGPALRRSFSVLYAEQRPFLLYSKDASITYLMPNAMVDHPQLSGYLRGILEERALNKWQEARSNPDKKQPAVGQRPNLVITGRVEDRFYSKAFSSLYLEERETIGSQKSPKRVLSFNFHHKKREPFGLSDLFMAGDQQALDSTIASIGAYIQADIVRQKTIRLGTQVSPEQDAWLKDFKPSIELLSTFTLVPSRQAGKVAGLSFHFNPGLLGAKADGKYSVYVPASIFAASLSDIYADHFAGEALRVSRHNAKGFSAASVNIDGLRSNAELGGDMVLEGEVPRSWCDGFHLTLTDKNSGQIMTEGLVELLPDLPPYGLSGNMLRFRAEISISGNGTSQGDLVFEPYAVKITKGRLQPRPTSACNPKKSITRPNPKRDLITIPVTF